MRKKIVALVMASVMTCASGTIYATENTDSRIAELESEVVALKERIDAIEQLLGNSEQEETTVQETEIETEATPDSGNTVDFDSMYKIESNGCTLYYDTSVVDVDYSGKPCLYVFGYFVNNSDSKQAASIVFLPEAYQDGIALQTMIYSQYSAFQNHSTFVLPGAEPLQVAFGFQLRNATSNVVLKINPMFSLSKTDAFSMTLTMPEN